MKQRERKKRKGREIETETGTDRETERGRQRERDRETEKERKRRRRTAEEREGEWRREERCKVVWMGCIVGIVKMLFFQMKLVSVSISLGSPGNVLPGRECKNQNRETIVIIEVSKFMKSSRMFMKETQKINSKQSVIRLIYERTYR